MLTRSLAGSVVIFVLVAGCSGSEDAPSLLDASRADAHEAGDVEHADGFAPADGRSLDAQAEAGSVDGEVAGQADASFGTGGGGHEPGIGDASASGGDAEGVDSGQGGAGGSSGDGSGRGGHDLGGSGGEPIDGGSSGSSAAGGGPGVAEGGLGGSSEAGKPDGGSLAEGRFCPEPSPHAPTFSNSVQVSYATLPADTEWTADKTWLVMSDLKVDGHVLTIDEGTTVCLVDGARISVGDVNPGAIRILGAPMQHVLFTAPADADGNPVFHRGVTLNAWMDSALSYLDILYGGSASSPDSWALELRATASPGTAGQVLLMNHVTVDQVEARGIAINSPDGFDPTSYVFFAGYHAGAGSFEPGIGGCATGPGNRDGGTADAGSADADSSEGGGAGAVRSCLGPAVRFDVRAASSATLDNFVIDATHIPNEAAYVDLVTSTTPGAIDRDAVLSNLGLPFRRVGPLAIGDPSGQNHPTWTIRGGVTLQLDDTLSVGNPASQTDGNLVIEGDPWSAALTSLRSEPAPGDWNGLYFHAGLFDPSVSKVDNAKILYAGSVTGTLHVAGCGIERRAAIAIEGTGQYAGPIIAHALIAGSASDGIASSSASTDTYMTTDYADAGILFKGNEGLGMDTAACP